MILPTWFGYDTDGRITSITDKDGNRSDYAYREGRVSVVTDPQIEGDPPPERVTQDFYYGSSLADGGRRTTYYDRRGSRWLFTYDASLRLKWLDNPFSARWTLGYDEHYNRTLTRDPLFNTW